MAKLSKKMQKATALVDKNKNYPLSEAVMLAQKASISKFDGFNWCGNKTKFRH